MNKATIGRKVLFVAAASMIASIGAAFVIGKLVQHDPVQPFDATITYVHSDSLVNLVVHDHNGHAHTFTSVQLVQPGTQVPGQAYAVWPSYAVVAVAGGAATGEPYSTASINGPVHSDQGTPDPGGGPGTNTA